MKRGKHNVKDETVFIHGDNIKGGYIWLYSRLKVMEKNGNCYQLFINCYPQGILRLTDNE